MVPERDRGVARGPGGPPYYGAETAKRFGDLSYAAAGIWRPDSGFTRVFEVVAGLVEALSTGDEPGDCGW
jgi:hypothetical protein